MEFDWARSSFDSVNFRGKTFIIKRDDLLRPIGGNKSRKLYALSQRDLSHVQSITSYGGSQSNAMLALSEFCKHHLISFDYYTRPVPKWLSKTPLGNLALALDNGMNWLISEKGLPPKSLTDAGTLMVPQGISMPEAELGVAKLAEEITAYCVKQSISDIAVVLPSGTGATALYLQQHLEFEVNTVPCIGQKETLMSFFKQQLPNAKRYPSILENNITKHFKFGEPNPELLKMHQELQETTGIEFELLYDAKTWINVMNWDANKPILYIHNGGTSGNPSMLARYKRLDML